ncbi:MAG: biopolymer transporter ExbD [Pseudomonadota bacterium]
MSRRMLNPLRFSLNWIPMFFVLVVLAACDAYEAEKTLDLENSALATHDIEASDANEILISEDGSFLWNGKLMSQDQLRERLQNFDNSSPNIILIVHPKAPSGLAITLRDQVNRSDYNLERLERADID